MPKGRANNPRGINQYSKGTHASGPHVTGTFKTYKKAAPKKSNALLPQKNSKGETTYANASGGRITQAEAAKRMFGASGKPKPKAKRKKR